MAVKVLIEFGPGQYSANKEKIKKLFSLFGYKYQSGNPVGKDKLICIWKRKPENQVIKGIFNGSGKQCQFIVECNEDEQEAFKSLGLHFSGRSKVYDEDSIDTRSMDKIASWKVNQWFTWQDSYPSEPELFYRERIKKMIASYYWFVEQEKKRMRDLL